MLPNLTDPERFRFTQIRIITSNGPLLSFYIHKQSKTEATRYHFAYDWRDLIVLLHALHKQIVLKSKKDKGPENTI